MNFRSQDFSENKHVINNGLVLDDLVQTREKFVDEFREGEKVKIFVKLAFNPYMMSSIGKSYCDSKMLFQSGWITCVMNHPYIDYGELQTEKDKTKFFLMKYMHATKF